MTVPLWPSDLPSCMMVDSFARGIDDARMFTEMDAGPDKSRVRGVKAEAAEGEIIITTDQYARFRRFWKEEIGNGVLPFLTKDQTFNGVVIDDLDDEDGVETTGTYYWLVVFGRETPRLTRFSQKRYRLSYTLLILPE